MRLNFWFHIVGTANDIIVINNLYPIHKPLDIAVLDISCFALCDALCIRKYVAASISFKTLDVASFINWLSSFSVNIVTFFAISFYFYP